MNYDVLIAGAGVIGGMLARELSRYQVKVCLLEKENDVACGASKANSGIIHGGFDPEPGSLKAEFNAKGIEPLYRAAEELNVPYRKNGSLVIAFAQDEEKTLEKLYLRGKENGADKIRLISGYEARRIEPKLSGEVTAALLAESAGIICPYKLTIAAVGNAMDNGAELKRRFEIMAIQREGDGFTVTAADGRQVKGKYLVNCTGSFADRIAEIAGDGFFKIIPRAGQYLLLDKTEGSSLSHTVFQVPSEKGKGVLVTPTADGNLLVGPNSYITDSPKDTRTTSQGLDEIMQRALKSIPSVNFKHVITSFCGVRASEKSGDFIVQTSNTVPGLVHAAAIDSPGLSSCVSIARRVVSLLSGCGLALVENPDFNPFREDTHDFWKMDDGQKDEYIKKNPSYGKIVCRCETITEGEIRDAVRRNPAALDLDGIKRRTRAGMGRCQGGFCSPHIMKIISEEAGMPISKVTKKGKDSFFLTEREED